jgi:hypothetical protein
MAACGTTTGAAGAGATETPTSQARAAATGTAAAQAQATVTAQPVALSVQLVQRGTVATHDVQLIATATIANHTAAPIHLANSFCVVDRANTTGGRPDGHPATIGLQVYEVPTHFSWYSWSNIECVAGAAFIDVQEVPARGSFVATLTCDLSLPSYPFVVVHAGVPYTIHVNIFFWHQGTVDQFLQVYLHPEQPGVLWGDGLAVEQPFTFH